jgi:lipoyl(octanoyl) transferase|tara:strand:- start:201 stop:857 length:657 start_codon:yes stop_codon:yes gene_type:complete
MNDMNQIEIKISNEEINYKEAVLFMESKVRDISENHSKELLWFLSHNHIFTQGTSASDDEILNSDVIEVLKTNRGGKTTYHGPGQRIVYFMLNLNNKKKDIRKFISVIENSVIDFLKNYNVEARAFKDRVGIWVIKNNKMTFDKEKKISAIGLRVKKWITYHGMSFNINPDLKYYNSIHSCGLKEYANTSLNELGIKIDQKEFDEGFKKIFLNKLKTI